MIAGQRVDQFALVVQMRAGDGDHLPVAACQGDVARSVESTRPPL